MAQQRDDDPADAEHREKHHRRLATPLIQVSTKCLFTNTDTRRAYRGVGRQEGNYCMERLVETAAHEMGINKVELRRRNHIQPRQMPYKAPSGMLTIAPSFLPQAARP